MTLTQTPAPATFTEVRELNADLDTPVSAYLKVTGGARKLSFLLESVEGGERQARYSFIGVGEVGRFTLHGNNGDPQRRAGRRTRPRKPWRRLTRSICSTAACCGPCKLPAEKFSGLPPFFGGAVGYAAYDIIRVYEQLPDANPDELKVPDALFIVPEGLVIFDHLRHKLYAVAISESEAEAGRIVDALETDLRGPLPDVPGREKAEPMTFESNFTPEGYQNAVKRCIEYIHAGDIFQVVPSQRFSADLTVEPFALYRALRGINPSPYLGFLNLGEVTLVASSPESLLRSDGVSIVTRPIAGTRPRGQTPEQDAALAEELLADEKERAEHLMLVDLGRNDIGRVAEYGSVTVEDAFTIERYSHVMHIVSGVRGKLRAGQTPLNALASALPMGTVSGAPKIRAMEIIDEVEPVRRGPYGGSFGYIAFDGSLDMALTLRTMVIANGKLHIQAGAGIVADSDPVAEELETRSKAAALMRAAERAAGGL